MNLEKLKKNWEELGESDPFWAVLTHPSKINNQWDAEEFYETGRLWVDGMFDLLKLEQLLNNKSYALDFGCGLGRLTQALCPKFKKVIGVDISSSMIKKAGWQNQFPENCDYRVNNSNDLSQFESNQFDFVMSIVTLQHIEKKYTLNYIKEFSRVVKEGGFILFNMPFKPPLILKILSKTIGLKGVNLIRQIYYGKRSVIEMHWIKEDELKDYLSEINLEIVKIEDDNIGKNWGSNVYLLKKATEK